MNRDNRGRFSSFKSKLGDYVTGILLLSMIGACIYAGISSKRLQAVEANVATSTPARMTVSRTDQVQQLITNLATQREQDPSFTAATEKMVEQLKEERHQQALLDAMLIVKTQYDVQLHDLTK